MSAQHPVISQDEIQSGVVYISPDEASPMAVNMKTNKHILLADEPKNLGGNDVAPSPYDYLHSGLGSCTAITLRFFARKNDIKLEDFHVTVTSRRDDNKNLIIDKELIFHDDLTEEEIETLVTISKKCPMHRDLLRSIEINTVVRR